MSTHEVIRLTDVSKRFQLRSHRSTLLSSLRAALGGPGVTRELRALDGVSFTVRRGERVGLVGGNGSGKSTLLRLLAGIFRPSSGEVAVTGRVAGILQAGAGMHRDLSATENAHLFGALLDISPASLARCLPAALAYAELTDFAHVPLRDFSFGMIQRLAFSLLLEARPEVLLLDELLSGADAAFTARACDSLEAAQGQTLLFASHDLPLVRRLCQRTLVMQKGKLVALGPTTEVLALYGGVQ